tara:strand:+ start:64 stop:696 length:633 start_codon:yes stop_codon:yes gene_type:complete
MSGLTKRLFCIRHGEAFHNVFFHIYGKDAYYDESKPDPCLTEKGINQALELNQSWDEKSNIELVITSPMIRCLETTTNIFKGVDVPIIAYEYAREFPLGLQYSNKRSKKSLLVDKFPHINFYNLGSEHDLMWDPDNYETKNQLDNRKIEVLKFIETRSEKNIALVTHSTFLMNFLYDYIDEDEDKELNHCHPYLKLIEGNSPEKHMESSF